MWGRNRSEAWEGAIGCEGGPVIIANADDFRHWTGSDALPLQERKAVHWWSSFTAELPEKFRPDGPSGHQFLFAGSVAELVRLRDEILAYVTGRWPGSVVTEEFETWIVRRPDGAQLRVCLDPTSEYDRCCDGLQDVKLHRYATDSECVVWFVEPGIVHIRRAPLARRLDLVQVTCADDENAEREALDHARGVQPGAGPTQMTFVVEPGPVVIAWAPNSHSDHQGDLQWTRMTPKDPGRILDLSTGSSAALLSVAAGTYGVVADSQETEHWSVRWCVMSAVDRHHREGG